MTENSLYYKHCEPLDNFFARLDHHGGWPAGKKVCFKHLDMRKPVEEVSFRDEDDGLNIMGRMILCTIDDYEAYKSHNGLVSREP